MKDELNQINRELKVYINEFSFISIKCRNKIIKIFAEEFKVNLDIENYKTVDLNIADDFKISYRDDLYTSSDNIKDIEEVVERYNRFKNRADKILKRKEVVFNKKSNIKNITNLGICICTILLACFVLMLGLSALFSKDYLNLLWLAFIFVPAIISRLRDTISDRFIQAGNYLKHLFKKNK